jgi:hypothetical protein
VTALTFTAVAIAAPKTGNWMASLGNTVLLQEGAGFFRISSAPAIRPKKGSPHIIAPSDYSCNTRSLALVKTKVPITSGKFKYTRAAYVNFGDTDNPVYKGKLTWKGRFTSKRKVKGTIRFVSPVTPKMTPQGPKFSQKECDTGTKAWVGKFGS